MIIRLSEHTVLTENKRKFIYRRGLKIVGKSSFLDLGVNGRTILNVILEEQRGECGLVLFTSEQRIVMAAFNCRVA